MKSSNYIYNVDFNLIMRLLLENASLVFRIKHNIKNEYLFRRRKWSENINIILK